MLGQPYGDSHDGRNGSTWAAGAESLRADPIGSRLGAVRPDDTVYANHPPFILLATASSELAFGDQPSSHRAVFVAASTASALLLLALLKKNDFSDGEAMLGVVAFVFTPMFRVFGSMVDTPVLALPFAIGMLIVAIDRQRNAMRRWHSALFLMGPLISWQLVLLEGLIVSLLVWREGWSKRHLSLAAAATAGVSVTGSWMLWVHGSIGPMLEQLVFRSGVGERSEVGLGDMLSMQAYAMQTLVGPLLFLAPFAIATAVDRQSRARSTAALGLGSVVGFDLLLSNGAAYHEYWSYWILISVAIGAAIAPRVIQRSAATRGIQGRWPLLATAGAVIVLSLAGYLVTPPQVPITTSGVDAAQKLASIDVPADQERLWVLAEFDPRLRWVTEAAPLPARSLYERDFQRELTRGNGHHRVLISTSCNLSDIACDRIPVQRDPYVERRFDVIRLAELGRF